MFRLRLIRCVLGAMLLAGLFGCEDGASNDVIGLNGERGLAPESGRDSGVLSSAVPYIDTGIGGVGSDFTPGTLCQSAQRRACSSQCGVQRCVSGQWTECGPLPETCNGKDDDCDGAADENLGLGSTCSNRQDNGCVAAGTLTCNFSTGEFSCEAMPMQPGIETCDGIDNDCDGQSDEDYPDQRCCTENYHCSPGAICTDGQCIGEPSTGQSAPRGATRGEACGNTFDCQFGLACGGGTCEPVCFAPGDCDAGLTCACHVNTPGCFLTICVDASVAAPPRQAESSSAAGDGNQPEAGPASSRNGQESLSCQQLTQLNGFGQYFNSTEGAVNELRTTCGGRSGGLERVFTFALEESQEIVLDTTGSSFDTVLAVRTNCNEIGTEMMCDDDGAGDLRSRVRFRAEAGRSYFVIVQGYRPDTGGDITLTFNESEGR